MPELLKQICFLKPQLDIARVRSELNAELCYPLKRRTQCGAPPLLSQGRPGGHEAMTAREQPGRPAGTPSDARVPPAIRAAAARQAAITSAPWPTRNAPSVAARFSCWWRRLRNRLHRPARRPALAGARLVLKETLRQRKHGYWLSYVGGPPYPDSQERRPHWADQLLNTHTS